MKFLVRTLYEIDARRVSHSQTGLRPVILAIDQTVVERQ